MTHDPAPAPHQPRPRKPLGPGDLVALRLNPTGPRWQVEAVQGDQVLLRLFGASFDGALLYGWAPASQYVLVRSA